MNRLRLFLVRNAYAIVLACSVFTLGVANYPAAGQQKTGDQGGDNDYSRKIKEYTTQPYFRTELVDHLPMSDKVPSPDKVLGYVVGTPNKLTYSKDLYRYYRELAKASPRVRPGWWHSPSD